MESHGVVAMGGGAAHLAENRFVTLDTGVRAGERSALALGKMIDGNLLLGCFASRSDAPPLRRVPGPVARIPPPEERPGAGLTIDSRRWERMSFEERVKFAAGVTFRWKFGK